MDPVHSGKDAAYAALVATTIAASVIPAAWPVVGIMYTYQCNPGSMYDVGHTWLELGSEFGKAADELDGLAHALTEDQWFGGDRQQFDLKIAEYTNRFTMAQILAVVVGVALIVMALLLFALIIVMDLIAAVLIAFMVCVLACDAGVVSAPAAAELIVEADAVAIEFAETLESCGNAVTAISQGMAGAISQAMEIDVVGQLLNGDKHVGHDLLQAVLDGKDTVLWGALAKIEQQGTGGLMKTGNPLPVAVGLGDGSPYGWKVPTATTVLKNEYDKHTPK